MTKVKSYPAHKASEYKKLVSECKSEGIELDGSEDIETLQLYLEAIDTGEQAEEAPKFSQEEFETAIEYDDCYIALRCLGLDVTGTEDIDTLYFYMHILGLRPLPDYELMVAKKEYKVESKIKSFCKSCKSLVKKFDIELKGTESLFVLQMILSLMGLIGPETDFVLDPEPKQKISRKKK